MQNIMFTYRVKLLFHSLWQFPFRSNNSLQVSPALPSIPVPTLASNNGMRVLGPLTFHWIDWLHFGQEEMRHCFVQPRTPFRQGENIANRTRQSDNACSLGKRALNVHSIGHAQPHFWRTILWKLIIFITLSLLLDTYFDCWRTRWNDAKT